MVMKKIVPGVAFLIAAGLAGNYFGYPVFFSSGYLFGSIFSMLALQAFGLVPGIIVALVVSAGAYFSGNHSYFALIAVGEVVAVGWFFSRNGKQLVFADTLYWLIIGMPLAYLCSRLVWELHSSLAAIFMFTKAINGICNTLIARLLFMLAQFRRREHVFPLQEVGFNLLALSLLVSSLAILIYEGHHDFGQFDRLIRQTLLGESRHTANSLNLWLEEKAIRVSNLAWRKKHDAEVSLANLDAMRDLDHDLAMVGIIGKNSISTIFSPVVDAFGKSTIGLDFSDRPYLKELKRTLQPQLSEVVLSKFGTAEPIVVLAAPIVVDGDYEGYAAGIFNIEKIRGILSLAGQENGLQCTLVDQNGLVIASTRLDLAIMAPFVRAEGKQLQSADGLVQWTPDRPGVRSSYDRWWHSVYFVESQVGRNGEWTLIVEQPVAPHQIELSAMYAAQMKVVFVILLLTMVFAQLVSRAILASLAKLHTISLRLQQDMTVVDRVSWPISMVSEVNFLIITVKEMACRLIAKNREIGVINESLEERIAERTCQLEELNKNLEAQVEEEVGRRYKQEQLLVQQAKLAAMGEMLGAIAHQWRQPLNTLGLCVQNIKDSYRSGDLDQGYLDATVGESMAQITQMSKTIDDFRDFFKPDKELSRFDAMAAAGQVLTLFSAQLRVHDIRFVLSCLTHQRTFDLVDDVSLCQEKEITGYENEFKHVILNLVSNAKDAICERREKGLMDAAEQGSIFFDFAKIGQEIVITVRDNGIGIPPLLRDRVFEPYFTTKDPGHGTGIGLYLSKIIIEDHFHGRLTVAESQQGAAFVISVPAHGNDCEVRGAVVAN